MTLRTRNSKRPLRMLARKLETPMAPAMPCKTSKKSKHGRPVAKPMRSNQNLRVSWKAREISGMIERCDPSSGFFTKLLRSDTLQRFFKFVVVRSFTADSNLLQPTGGVNSTPHTSHFLLDSHLMSRTCVAQGSSSSLTCAAHISRHRMRHLHALMLCV